MNLRFVRGEIRKKIPRPTTFVRIPAIMGDGNGNVSVPDQPGFVYIRFLNGLPWTVWNGGKAPEADNYKIWIGTDENMPLRMHVLGLQDVYQDPGTAGEFDSSTLIWPGSNTLWVHAEQFLPGLAMPIPGSMQIHFLPWKVVIDNVIVQIREQTVNFASYVPASGAKWVLVEYDQNGDLNYVEGVSVVSKSLLTVDNIPSPTAGSKYFWALKVYDGQTQFSWSTSNNDLVDLRWSGSLTGDAASLTYAPIDVNDWDYLADPGEVNDALDQLADRVKSLEIVPPVDAANVAYTPFVPADWDYLADPGNVDDALNQLASRTKDLEGVPPGTWDGDITDLDETSSADIGEAIADTDQGIIFNQSASAWVRFAWSRVKTYIQALTDTLYAPIAKGVTNGDSHDHSGGDGAQIDHTGLSNIGTNTHAQIDTHLSASAPHSGHATTSQIREKLTAARTYYVRTDGNDSNTGLVDSAGGAFLTLQKADDVVSALDDGGYAITVQVKDGTFTGGTNLAGPAIQRGTYTIQGNSGTPANVVISTTSDDCFYSNKPVNVTIKDMKLQTTTSGNGIYCDHPAAFITFANLNFGACAASQIRCDFGKVENIASNYTISGGAVYHWLIPISSGVIAIANITITVSGTPAFSGAFATLYAGMVSIYSPTTTISGGATGKRYDVSLNGVLNTFGGGANYLPGDSAGTTATGGQYA